MSTGGLKKMQTSKSPEPAHTVRNSIIVLIVSPMSLARREFSTSIITRISKKEVPLMSKLMDYIFLL
jgi:hypothetical protein